MWPDEHVVRFVSEHFLTARVHVRDQADDYQKYSQRYGVEWTPTILVLDPQGEERHRVEGFLPARDLIAQLALGLGRVEMARGELDDAERQFREVVARHPESEAAPEALYWAGVARYKESHDASALADTAREFRERYTDTSWAKKASVWAREGAAEARG